ncbi:MAG: T9SS type A sorting domain-containing protein [candidate division WOR-3 bacterium]|nr:T9SS type A sorting domain-containing protein [candidate division WOR-3 bacterium]
MRGIILISILFSLSFSQVLIWHDDMTNFPQNWTLGGVGDTWTRVSNRYNSSLYSAKCSKDSLYRNNTNIWMERSVNLGGFYSGAVVFYIYQDLDTSDYIYFEYLVGDSWITFWQSNGFVGGFIQRVMSPIPNTATKIRFRFFSDSVNVIEGVYIDDVTVYGYRYDVGVTEIIAPKGILDSGITITPKAKVKNFGDFMTTCTVRMRIGTFYNNLQIVSNLSPGQVREVNFSSWQVRQRGTHIVKCSTQLRNDYNPNNDWKVETIFVRVRDVGVVSILAPTGTVDSGVLIIPQARIRNHGNTNESFWVLFRVGNNYRDSLFLNLIAGRETTLSFNQWLAIQRGKHYVRCSLLISDFIPSNNQRIDSVFVRVFDIGIREILQPLGIVDSGTNTIPRARIRNYGNVNVNFKSYFKIGNIYWDSLICNLPAERETILSFSQWYAAVRGKHLIKCSLLISDRFPNNNYQIDSVFVRVWDCGVKEILAPTGIIDSGTLVIPQAKIRNYGNIDQEFSVLFKIGGFYTHSIYLYLPAERETTLSFNEWQANERGEHLVKCTLLLVDNFPNNNYRIDSVFVRVWDCGIKEILAPKDIIDSGITIIPEIKIKNYGNVDDEFSVIFKIGDFYNDSLYLHLSAEKETTLFFDEWQVNERGKHLVKCSLSLTDNFPNNNYQIDSVFVQVLDVGITEIISPQGNVDSTGILTPEAKVKNYGNTSVNFFTTIKIIGDEYYWINETYVENLLPNEERRISFPNWLIAKRGEYIVICSTRLVNDRIPINNKKEERFSVQVHDCGIITIFSPPEDCDSNKTYPVIALIKNYGTINKDLKLSFRIGEDYLSVKPITTNAGESLLVEFDSWQPKRRDYLCSQCVIESCPQDINPFNDTVRSVHFVRVKDAGILRIVSPSDSVSEGEIIPKIEIKNFGNISVRSLIKIVIYQNNLPIYTDSFFVDIHPNEIQIISFSPWQAYEGSFTFYAAVILDEDMQPVNDTLFKNFIVESYEPWVLLRDIPRGNYKGVRGGGALAFGNNQVFAFKGNNTREFYIYSCQTRTWREGKSLPAGDKGKNIKDGGALVYDKRNNLIFATKGNKTKEFYCYYPELDSWERKKDIPGKKGIGGGSGVTYFSLSADTNYIVLLKGGTKEFYAYWIERDSWLALKALPGEKKFKKGSALTTDNNYIYILKGNTNEFFAYDIRKDSFEIRKSLPLIGRNLKKKKTKDGASLCCDGERIYAFKGGNCNEFWCYEILNNEWNELEPIPLLPSNKRVKSGGALVYDYINKRIYALKGSNTYEFWRYLPRRTFLTKEDLRKEIPSAINIEKLSLINKKVKEIKIYNLLGNLVYQKKNSKEMPRLRKGIYIIKVKFEDYEINKKVFIIH